MSYNTILTYEGDGSTRDFPITFPYLKQDDVYVTRHNGPVSYVFLNSNVIRTSKPIDVGDTLVIERRTNISSPSVVFQNGSSFTGDNINSSLNQVRFAVQEAIDRVGTVYARTYVISSIDGSFNGFSKSFRLDSGGENLGAKVYDTGLWLVTLNGISLEQNVDYTIDVVNGLATITFVNAPKRTDATKLTFIRFYEDATNTGSGVNGANILDDLNDVVINNPTVGHVLFYNGTRWVNTLNPTMGGSISSSPTTPAACTIENDVLFNTTNSRLYICNNGQYVDILQGFVPTVPNGITIVDTLPPTGTDGQVVFNQSDNKMYKRTSGTWLVVVAPIDFASAVADGSISASKFASGVRPIEVLGELPTTGNFDGRVVYLTTDKKIYRYNGTNFTATISANDIVGGLLTDQIANGAVTNAKIASSAVNVDQLASNSVTNSKIATGAITTDKLAALSISASAIAANAITTDKINNGAVTADKLAAGAISSSSIAAGSITAEKLAQGQILIKEAQLAAGSVSTVKMAANSATSITNVVSNSMQSVSGTSWVTVLSCVITSAGTQPTVVWANCLLPGYRLGSSTLYDIYLDGNYWKANTASTDVDLEVIATQGSKTVGQGVLASTTTQVLGVNPGSILTNLGILAAGTWVITFRVRKSPTYSTKENFSVRNVNITVLETRR